MRFIDLTSIEQNLAILTCSVLGICAWKALDLTMYVMSEMWVY